MRDNSVPVGLTAFVTGVLVSFILLLSSVAGGATVSILSLLAPRRVQVQLKTPAVLTVLSNDQQAPQRSELTTGTRLDVKLSAGGLLLAGHNLQQAAISCDGGCIAVISVTGKTRLYHGDLRLGPTTHNTIDIILETENEELTASVLESERSPRASPEGLRAMAIVVRSFIAAGARHTGAAFCDTTHCQVFQGLAPSIEVRDAVRATSGMLLLYKDAPFRPYFTRSCGGRTSSYIDVWGKASPDYPFFPVACPCSDHGSGWKSELSAQVLSRITAMPDPRLRREANWISVFNADSTQRYTAENFRTLLGRTNGWKILPGNHFTIQENSGGWIFTGHGAGHGVGFCVQGADVLAQQGLDYRAILARYFPNTTIEARI